MWGQILFKRTALAVGMVTVCAACGQKGPLYLPNDPESRDRATLPQVLLPTLPGSSNPPPPSAPPRESP
ncbi:MAG: lipoprotein [Alphaproteobacteria bacterium]|nr:lipoprotein [Alphaproteobacteria bacterium]MDI9329857.1 lipoprotein [Alphaproteobacteria bacterium]